MGACEDTPLPDLSSYRIVRELALNGAASQIEGGLPIEVAARRQGRRTQLLTSANVAEAALVESLTVFEVRSLGKTVAFLRGEIPLEPSMHTACESLHEATQQVSGADFCDVRGQLRAKRVIEAAVSGGHSLFMLGPPCSEKSILAKRIP